MEREHADNTSLESGLNQLLCKPVNSAWTGRVQSIARRLFTVLVENEVATRRRRFWSLSKGEGREHHKR